MEWERVGRNAPSSGIAAAYPSPTPSDPGQLVMATASPTALPTTRATPTGALSGPTSLPSALIVVGSTSSAVSATEPADAAREPPTPGGRGGHYTM